MPHGTTSTSFEPAMSSPYGKTVKLLDGLKATDPLVQTNIYIGSWIDISTLKAASVEVIVLAALTGTVNIEGSNMDNPPDDTTVGQALMTAVTGAGLSLLNKLPVKRVRVRMTGFSAGQVSVNLHGVA